MALSCGEKSRKTSGTRVVNRLLLKDNNYLLRALLSSSLHALQAYDAPSS